MRTDDEHWGRRLVAALRRVPRAGLLALMPILLISAQFLGGPTVMILVALAFPLGLALAPPPPPQVDTDRVTGLPLRAAAVAASDRHLRHGARSTRAIAAFAIEIDQFARIEERHDHTVAEDVLRTVARRLGHALRETDIAVRLDGPSFAVVVAPARRLDLEAALHLAGRLQRSLSEPVRFDGLSVHPTVSVGFALSTRIEITNGDALMRAAAVALREAVRSGPGAIRSFSPALKDRVISRNNLAEDVAGALDRGEITAFFQPQIQTRTGDISGFEALARWHHPVRGLIPPAEFLPALEQAGLMDRLGEVMLQTALSALRRWDDEGLVVPHVGVNFSSHELGDPRLVDRIMWDLDRFDLTPDRLVIEVLETVVATRSEDMVIQNLAGLARLGCCLDLDDFGTGHASITSIRRFAIERIKIDRSFVTRIDTDPEQQKMVSAILTMAERLGLDTLAEGVETEAERAVLTDLNCGHLQGFGIARPMPLAEADVWLRAEMARRTGDGVVALPRRAVPGQ